MLSNTHFKDPMCVYCMQSAEWNETWKKRLTIELNIESVGLILSGCVSHSICFKAFNMPIKGERSHTPLILKLLIFIYLLFLWNGSDECFSKKQKGDGGKSEWIGKRSRSQSIFKQIWFEIKSYRRLWNERQIYHRKSGTLKEEDATHFRIHILKFRIFASFWMPMMFSTWNNSDYVNRSR